VTSTGPPPDLPEQVQVRRGKLDRLRAAGVDPYPLGYPRTTTVPELRRRFPDLPPDTATGEQVAVAGRVVLNRPSGRLTFATLQESGERVQAMLTADGVGPGRLAAWKTDVDLGDHVGVTGEVVTTRRGELTVRAASWALTSKALRPLPDKHHGLADPEARVRQRYLDLLVRPETRRLVELRAGAVWSLRSGLRSRGFLEVETPMLQPVHGGAAARPFRTHMHALDLPLYLRIAPELYLKRLVVGGLDRVFELNRNFRNEGVDATHNPEFTMVEAYEAYGDYDTVARLTRELVQEAALAATGSLVVPIPGGGGIDLSGEWPTVTVHAAVSRALGEEVTPSSTVPALTTLADRAGVAVHPSWGAGALVLELYEKLVESATVAPTFYRDFPTEVSPLTRGHRDDPRLAERWDLVARGFELGTGYSELVDPVEQRRRLAEQSRRAAGGDPEAMQLDEDFLRALEYGMPPCGGIGLGVERLLMLLTGATSMRDGLILFPLVRPDVD
jgi:lysyl-tRNA synthetase class 2